MKRIHIIIIAAIVVAVILGLIFGLSMKSSGGFYGGNIGVIEITSTIMSSKAIVQDLVDFEDNPSVKAIIIRVNSPGGGVAASQEIYRQVEKIRETKQVVVSMGSVAASGGYYVALPAHVIVANPGTITGSIGVIMEFPVLQKLLDKIGIEFEVIKSRDHKDIGSPFRPITEKERELLEGVILDVYDQFVTATAEYRNLPIDSVLKYADGRIMTGRQAKDLGFVDSLGSFEDAIDIISEMAGIEDPFLVYPPRRLSFIDLFTEPIEQILTPKLRYMWR